MSEWRETEIGLIPKEWNYIPFKQVLAEPTRNGIYKSKEYHGTGIRVVNMKEIFAFDKLPNIEMSRIELTKSELEKASVHENDLLFARRSIVAEGAGKCTLILNQKEPLTFESSIIRVRPDQERANSEYIFYLFFSTFGKYLLRTILRQVAVSGITGTDLVNLKLPLPALQEQKKIAAVLSCLDAKIENLRKQNETLERIAQTLFKHWFIDFEFPNEKGEPYRSSGGAMQPSELGEIPAGWRVSPFETTFLISLRNGLTKPRQVRGRGFYMVNMGELFANKRIGDLEMDRVPLSEAEFQKSMLQTGDILFARQSLIREGAGQCSIITESSEKRTFEGHLIRCRIDPKKANSFYFFYHFWSCAGRFQIQALVEQVAAAGIRASDLAKLEVLIPPINLQNLFFSIIKPMEQSIALNLRQIQTLTKTRDTLLPKLMSGKLRLTK